MAYLADEVGMGKTYVALGALALFRHFHPDFRVLIIAPRENIQNEVDEGAPELRRPQRPLPGPARGRSTADRRGRSWPAATCCDFVREVTSTPTATSSCG